MITWQEVFAGKLEEMHVIDSWTLVEDDALQVQACRPGWKEFVLRRALGRFQCSQCFHKWSSAKVHILFHMNQCQGWGTVRMRIFRQECRQCPKPRLEDPEFSLETVETILHNVVIKIRQYFYNQPVQPSDLLEVVVDTPVAGPHDSAHCEACRLGICHRSRSAPAQDACKALTDEDKARMHSTNSSDAWNALSGVRKARAHHTHLHPALVRVAQDANVPRTSQTLKYQGSRPRPASTHHPSSRNRNLSWKRCCCIGSSLISLCVVAVILYLVFYFTMKTEGPGDHSSPTEGPGDHSSSTEELGQWVPTVSPYSWLSKAFPALGGRRKH